MNVTSDTLQLLAQSLGSRNLALEVELAHVRTQLTAALAHNEELAARLEGAQDGDEPAAS